MKSFVYIFGVLFVAYLAICLLLYLFQKRFVFHPNRRLEATPDDIGLPYEDVTFEAEDGIKLHAWFVPAAVSRGAVLFCHGNAGNVSHRMNSLRLFNELGLTALAFDYRSYGRSEGSASESGIYSNSLGAWRYLTRVRGFNPEEVVIFGRSLGAAVALELATRVRPAAVVAKSAFTSALEIGRRYYPLLPVKLLLRIKLDSAARVREITAPKLFIHSLGDEIIPVDVGRKLYELAAEPKQFLLIQGPHNGGWMASREIYVKGWTEFLESIPRLHKSVP